MPNVVMLALFAQRDDKGELPPLPDLPEGVPACVENVGKAMNDAILLGEIFGIGVSEALIRCNEVFGMFEAYPSTSRGGHFFNDDDLPILRDAYSAVAQKLRDALDDHGAPRGELGDILVNSSHIAAREGGLCVRGRWKTLLEECEQLEAIVRMIDFAIRNGLLVEMQA